jgi:hypothetical protein
MCETQLFSDRNHCWLHEHKSHRSLCFQTSWFSSEFWKGKKHMFAAALCVELMAAQLLHVRWQFGQMLKIVVF